VKPRGASNHRQTEAEQAIIGKLKQGTLDLLTKENGALSLVLSSFFSKIGLDYALNIIDNSRMEYINVIVKIISAFT
jgi:hypothetical protein